MKRSVLIRAILVVAVVIAVAWLWQSSSTPTATISLIPAQKSLTVGQELSVPLTVDVPTAINAGEFNFSFPADLLQVKEIKKDDSFFALWVKDSPRFDNATGTINIAGGLPTPGFSGQGTVATVVFTAKTAGTAAVSLNQTTTRLLANDGLGSAVTSRFRTAKVEIR